MRRLLVVLAVAFTTDRPALGQTEQPVSGLLRIHQYDLTAEGKALLDARR